MNRFLIEMWDWKTFAAATTTVLVVVSCWFAVSDELKDRATAAAYVQTLKDQRVERARTSKEIAELRNRVDVLIWSIQESGGTIPPEALNGAAPIRRQAATFNDDDDDDGDSSITVNNPPASGRTDENPTPKAPESPPSTAPPDTVEDLTKRVEDAIEDLPNNPLMEGTQK